MPISVSGLPLHTRSLTVRLTRDSESRWLARGDVIDLRKNGFVPSSYDIQPSGIIHSMSIELLLEPKTLEIERIQVDQPYVAVEASEATEGECCRDPAPRLLDFAGDRLDSDFTKRLSTHFGGALGCSHLLTLFQLMASTIPLAAGLEHDRIDREGTEPVLHDPFFRRSLFVDGYLGEEDGIDVSVQLADTHSRPIGSEGAMTERLETSREWKILAEIGRPRFDVRSLVASSRSTRHDTLATATWIDQRERVASLSGVPLIPGMAGRIFRLAQAEEQAGTHPDRTERAMLGDALLQLAPGFIQIIAALMGDTVRDQARRAAQADAAPSVLSSIGTTNRNSCYMWREGSAISRGWKRAAERDEARRLATSPNGKSETG